VTPWFITFEGGEGCGKTTQAKRLQQRLGDSAIFTREPGGTPGAEILRTMLLHGDHEFSAPAQVFLHFAARTEHVERLIKPTLAAGKTVICDRFFDSTLAYQGFGQYAPRATIEELSKVIGIVPDLTFILRVSPAIAAARVASRGAALDRYESHDAAFHARVAAGFEEIAAQNPARCAIIDADQNIDQVHQAIWATYLARTQ